MPNSNGAVDLGTLSPEDQEALEAMAADNPPEDEADQKIQVLTGFVVVMTEDGDVRAAPLDSASQFRIAMEPSDDLIYSLVSVVQKDIVTKTSASLAVEFQVQQVRAMQEQMQAAQVAQGIDLSKLRS